MKTIRDYAKVYEPKKTLNISELKRISTELVIEEKVLTDRNGIEFDMLVTTIEHEDYRVPVSVLKQLKVLIEEKPSMVCFKVNKTGEGLNTLYTVIPVD